jgi:hypothetical protein
MKTKSQRGTKEAIEQLNHWSKSEVTVKLVVRPRIQGPFCVCHTGCVRKFPSDVYDIFYLEPNEGGGTFEFDPDTCQPTIRRTKTYTQVCFTEGGVSLFLLELFRDPAGEELGTASAETLDGEVERP